MVKKGIILFLLFIGVVVGVGYYFTNTAEYPEFQTIKNIKLQNLKLAPNLNFTFAGDVFIYNPNPFQVTVDEMDFEVFVDGKKATTIRQNMDAPLISSSTSSLPILFEIDLKENKLNLKSIGKALKGALKEQSMNLKCEGTITINTATLPFKIPFEYEEIYKLKDFIK